MKAKQLILATAMSVAVSGAWAQTNVSIYGIVDAGVEFLTNAGTVAGQSKDLARLSSGNLAGSRLGFRGTEDLGGGLKAVFQLENGFDTDTGALAQGGRLFGRQAFVGLQSSYGALTLGRQQNSLYDLIIQYDPMSFSARYSAMTHDATFTGRADNAIKYTGNFGPVTTTAFYSLGRNLDGEVPGNPKVSRNFGGGVAYAAGPFGVGLAFDQYHGNTIATQDQTAKRIALGANYTLGAVKAFAGYRRLNDEIVAAGTPEVKANLVWLGAAYRPATALTLTGALYRTDFKNSGADPMSLVLSADYAFSKRTDGYVTVARANNKNGSNLGLNGYGSTIVAGQDQTGVIVGVRHRF